MIERLPGKQGETVNEEQHVKETGTAEPITDKTDDVEEAEAVETFVVEEEAEAFEEEEELDLETRLSQAEAQAAEYLDGWQRARAELANFKKRAERERGQWEMMFRGVVIGDLLPVLDDLDLAMKNLPDSLKGHEWANGIALIHHKLHAQLEDMGLSEIEAQGQPFDPELHEAVAQITSSEHEPGTVGVVLRKGYRLGDRVLRAALVHVVGEFD